MVTLDCNLEQFKSRKWVCSQEENRVAGVALRAGHGSHV